MVLGYPQWLLFERIAVKAESETESLWHHISKVAPKRFSPGWSFEPFLLYHPFPLKSTYAGEEPWVAIALLSIPYEF